MVFYKEAINSKTSQKIPVFSTGHLAHSKYNPEREAENFGKEGDGAGFAVVLGIAGGYHIAAFLKRNPDCKIVTLERTADDIKFLEENIECAKSVLQNANVLCATIENIESVLVQNYVPQMHGNIAILTLRVWADEDKAFFESAMQKINYALKKITADISVQAHFGLIWQKNIFCNLRTIQKMQAGKFGNKHTTSALPKIDTTKTAAIIGAGPTLDKTISRITKNREKYFVIATDTSLKSLMRRGVQADAAVSIDAQALSANHFVGTIQNKTPSKTIFVFDLAADSGAVRATAESNARIIFVHSGHPLSVFATNFFDAPPVRLDSGGGTVAIAALDFAKKCGFENAEVFGADFAYSSGKAYAKGTYLDDLYRMNESRADTAETRFAALMYRSPLRAWSDGGKTFFSTEVLDTYKETFLEWARQNALENHAEGFVRKMRLRLETRILPDEKKCLPCFDTKKFKDAFSQGIIKERARFEKTRRLDLASPFCKIAMPYLAFLQKKNFETAGAFALALNGFMEYNEEL